MLNSQWSIKFQDKKKVLLEDNRGIYFPGKSFELNQNLNV